MIWGNIQDFWTWFFFDQSISEEQRNAVDNNAAFRRDIYLETGAPTCGIMEQYRNAGELPQAALDAAENLAFELGMFLIPGPADEIVVHGHRAQRWSRTCVRNADNTIDLVVRSRPRGNTELANLIRQINGMGVSAAEKARLLTEGAATIDGIVFNAVDAFPGAQAVFKGSPITAEGPLKGSSPVLAILNDGTIVKGFDIPHPWGFDYFVIDPKKLVPLL